MTIELPRQNTTEWVDWRKQHIGASDVPSIMGTSDFSSPLKLWLEKTGQTKPFEGNWATQRGHELEPMVRDLFERKFNCKAPPVSLEYAEWPILSASLDGHTGEAVVEIKCPSLEKHQMAVAGLIPETYKDQIQAQLLVSGLTACFYVSFHADDIDDIAIVTVLEDKVRQQQILEAAKEFWECVQTRTPPKEISNQPELESVLNELSEVKLKIKDLETKKEEMERVIQNQMRADKVISGKYITSWGNRQGGIDYKKIPELKSVDLDKYRKESSRVFSVKMIK